MAFSPYYSDNRDAHGDDKAGKKEVLFEGVYRLSDRQEGSVI
jgi:hypothetical protein